jgi:beta-lactam-binding protein with PASTA domain
VSFINSGLSAIGRLAALALLAGAFLFGLAMVVYMSLQGSEIKVPEITGKDLSDSEKELASLGLKIKKRADRISAEQPGTVIEQLPKAGETVKTGQLILVVTSKGPGEGGVTPPKNTSDEDDSEKIEEMISDKPKKPKANSNTNRKKADTTRDVNAAPSNSNSDSNSSTNSNSNSSSTNSNKAGNSNKSGGNSNSSDKPNRNSQTPPGRLPNPTTKPSSGERPKKPQR